MYLSSIFSFLSSHYIFPYFMSVVYLTFFCHLWILFKPIYFVSLFHIFLFPIFLCSLGLVFICLFVWLTIRSRLLMSLFYGFRCYGPTTYNTKTQTNKQIDIGTVPIPKSVNKARIEENLNVFDFSLTADEIKLIDTYNTNERVIWFWESKHDKHWPFGTEY